MKRKKAHRKPLTNEAIKILELIRPQNIYCEFVFPDELDLDSHASFFIANADLKRSLGFKGELVAHGLRAISSTALHEEGFDTLLIEACLSHSTQNEIQANYNYSFFF